MTESEILEFINFISQELYLFIAFMCGLILGYIVGYRTGGGE